MGVFDLYSRIFSYWIYSCVLTLPALGLRTERKYAVCVSVCVMLKHE